MMNGVGDLSSPLNAGRFDVGTGVRTTLRWREMDSNHRFRGRRPASSWCRLSFAPTFPRAGSQAEVMSRRRKLGRVTRNQWFESGFLQRRVVRTPVRWSTDRHANDVGNPVEFVGFTANFHSSSSFSLSRHTGRPRTSHPAGTWRPLINCRSFASMRESASVA